MRFVVRLLRYRGRAIPWREALNRPPLYGDLRIEECHSDETRRYVRIARLVDLVDTRPSPETPELHDVTIIAMSPQAFTLLGFERIDGALYAQAWLVTDGV